ncbi:MAG: response regulator transcription factor [Zoogloeaceae bacterium]|jgi:DNA-binding response OmpR family regulator|nr:response regulator transcription factor [Zoogloeaceae bacterium]
MNQDQLRVYLIEDEEDLREALVYSLTQMGFDASGFADAGAFYRAFAVSRCDVVVIDIGLPGEDGFEIAAHLRSIANIGIVFATARGTVEDRIRGMREGADAYLVKPLHPEELAATLEAVGKRLRASADAPVRREQDVGEVGKWQLTNGDWCLRDPDGQSLKLTTAERAFLVCLFKERGAPVSREDISQALSGNQSELLDLQRIDALASRLRRKALNQGMELPLHAVRGVGYSFE